MLNDKLTQEEREAVTWLEFMDSKAYGSAGCPEAATLLALIDRLAGDADDGEPVTEDWLRSVGFRRTECNEHRISCHPEIDNKLVIEEDGSVAIANGDYGADDYDYLAVGVVIKKRADLRRLCAALGIQLPTPGGSTDANK